MGMLAFVVIISIIIGFHEGAHLLFMKLFGVKALKFSIGFGPVLFKKKIGDTEYLLCAIPLGGYVLPLSRGLPEEYAEYEEPNHPEKYFESKPAWQRMVIYLVGPLSNLLFAFVLYFLLFAAVGLPHRLATLEVVNKNSPADIAGLRAGDKILSVDGVPVSDWTIVTERIQKKNGGSVVFRVSRNSEIREFVVTPREESTDTEKRFLIGILPKVEYRRMGLVVSFKEATKVTIEALGMFWNFLKTLVTGGAKRDSFGGVIMIYQATSESADQGWLAMMGIVIMLNLNLFFFNILPIPLLDGGQIYPALFEMITGIRPSKRFLKVWMIIGIVLLLSLFLLGTYNDLSRIFTR